MNQYIKTMCVLGTVSVTVVAIHAFAGLTFRRDEDIRYDEIRYEVEQEYAERNRQWRERHENIWRETYRELEEELRNANES